MALRILAKFVFMFLRNPEVTFSWFYFLLLQSILV